MLGAAALSKGVPMMKRYIVLAALLSAVSPAGAQTMAPGAASVAPAMPLTPQTFRQMAMVSDTFEIESSRLALQRSRNPRVRAFAQQMVRDHTMTSEAMMGRPGGAGAGLVTGAVVGGVVGGPVGAVVGAGVGATAAATPSFGAGPTLDARHAAMLNQLAAARGPQFDRLYGRMQLLAHREAVAMFATYAQ